MPAIATPSRRRRRGLLAACITLWTTEAVLTHIPLPTLPPAAPSDKTMHFAAYFVLATSLLLTLWAYGRSLSRRQMLTFLVMAAYGAVDELTQPLVNRHASLLDWIASAAGAAAAVAVHALVVMLHRRRRRAVDA